MGIPHDHVLHIANKTNLDDTPKNMDESKSEPSSVKKVYTAARNMLLAHSAAVQSYRTKFQEHQKGKIGITLVSHWFEPLYDTHFEDKRAAERGLDFMLGWFLEPVLTGQYPQNMIDCVPPANLAPFSEKESELLKGSIDFLGLNYYTAKYAADDPHPSKIGYYGDQKAAYTFIKDGKPISELSGADWLYIVPWGIYKLLKYVQSKYKNVPAIYITENAYEACADKTRVNYYRDHLGNILKAMKQQVNIKGYSWSDNFEWKDGYTNRFGLIYIDYMNHLKRYPKDSAMWFTKFLVRKPAKESRVKEGRSRRHPEA
ncbi:hypothetical protein BUALT_Bualt10G0132200 [Buddleja alternifolia]|uniref:Beta-glucosidase n=1 Tax=Buddleja alternifolia TaxID=168488 RepID=A0AAV6X054_9LAMI|nr:hypothetical protein BUALT_Bualt10G0132200 [Buddleja alternifolia]